MSLPSTITASLTDEELGLIDAYWRAANYLSVGEVYLLDNPLLREPLRPDHIKPRLLGHFGTVPGLKERQDRTPPFPPRAVRFKCSCSRRARTW